MRKSKDGKFSTPEVASFFGVSREAVSRARRDGQLTEGVSWNKLKTGRYRFDIVETKREWNQSAGNSNRKQVGGADNGGNNVTSMASINKAKALVDLEKKKIELDQLKGILVEKNKVYKELFEFGQKIRQRMQAIPARIVDDVLACESRVDALRLITEAVENGLLDLADADKINFK